VTVVLCIGFIGIGSSHAQENLLANGGFENGVFAPWGTYGSVTTEVVKQLVGAAVPEGPIEGAFCLHVTVPTAGANFWDVGLQHGGHTFQAGKKYTLSAFCKCKQGTLQINFKPELAQDPWTAYGEQVITMTDQWKEYSVTTPVFATDTTPGNITFHIGFAAAEFWIDGVRFYEGDYVASRSNVARYPSPKDRSTHEEVWANLTWTAGDLAVSHDVYFGEDFDAVNEGTAGTFRGNKPDTYFIVGFAGCPYPEGLVPGKTYYWRIDEVNPTHPDSPWKGSVWSFSIPSKKAYQPSPASGTKFVDPAVDLTWQKGYKAAIHYVYFGDDYDTVNNAVGAVPQPMTTYDPKTLQFEKTYYWRVDEFDSKDMHKGDVWSFTTAPPGLGKVRREIWENITGTDLNTLKSNFNYPSNPTVSDDLTSFNSPEYGDNYGGRLHGWLHVPVAGNYTFWVAGDDQTELWLSTDDDPANAVLIASVPEYANPQEWEKYPSQQSQPITLQADRYYIMALWKEGEGGDHCAAAWQGPGIATRAVIAGTYVKPFEALWALGPKPSNRATDVSQATALSWKPGEKAAKHDVYFGTNEQAVANAGTTTTGIYRGRQNLDATGFILPEAPLEWAKTYYWRIDEVNDLELASPWQGTVWSFTTANFIVVDDFEQYTDDVANRIFRTWLDGWGYTEPAPGYGGNGTGSAVGYGQAPFAEQTIVHSGKQSMPLAYDNSGTGGKARYSETQREWTTPQDWTTKGVKALTLWFHGDPNNSAEPLYVAVKDSLGRTKVVTYANPNAAMSNNWQEWNIDMKELVSAGLNLASVKTMYIGLGNRVTPKGGGKGTIYIDDIRLYLPRCIASVLKPAADLSGNCVVDYLDLQIIANNWLATATAPNDAKLVAHYTLDGNFNDSSSYTGLQNGDPRNGAAIISDPVRGQVAHFDGVDDYVDCGTFNPSAATGKLSITVWMKWAGPNGGWQGVIGKRDAWTDTDTMWCIEVDRDSSDCRFFQFNSSPEHGINVPPIGEWQHFAVSFDGTNAALYINGESIGGSQPFVFGPKTDARVVFGACEQNGGNPFNGDLDEIRIYDYALSAAEVFYLAEPAVDLNNDNKVNFADFAILADAWLDELLWPQP
jgi:hypothetical protein